MGSKVTKWRAFDGKEFDTEHACDEYEDCKTREKDIRTILKKFRATLDNKDIQDSGDSERGNFDDFMDRLVEFLPRHLDLRRDKE